MSVSSAFGKRASCLGALIPTVGSLVNFPSVLRNLKIIGIFTRLSIRDEKDNYLKLIPYAWKLIDNRIKNNPNFHELKNFLQKNPRIKKI